LNHARFFFAVFLFLAGCTAAQAPAPAADTPSPPAVSPSPALALEPVLAATAASTAEPTPLPPTLTPTPTAPAVQVCSPLVEHPIDELLLIVSDPYYRPPANNPEGRHHGVDFSYYRRGERESIAGIGVQAVLPGRVAMALADSFPYGNVVIIETPRAALPPDLLEAAALEEGESLYLLYAHMEGAPLVQVGDPVEACQPLGAVGRSGNAGIAHLHWEARRGPQGTTFTDMQFYDTRAAQEQIDDYLLWRISGVYRHFNPLELLFPGRVFPTVTPTPRE